MLKQFAGWGMRPQGVPGGEAALEAAAQAHDRCDSFDLAVVDFQMPGMDGGDLARRLKADPRFQAMPLIMLTSPGRPGDAPAACLAAHTIKGMAANMGAEALPALAGTVEAEARAGNLEAMLEFMPELEARFEQFKKAVESCLPTAES